MVILNNEDVDKAIDRVISEHNRIDVLVNNAGYGLWGAVETISIDEAKRQFDYAKREREIEKKLAYIAEGMSNLSQSVEHVSNTTVPLAKVAFAASLLAESIQDNLDNQTKDIVKQIKG